MNRTRLHQVLWVIEAVVGALPGTVFALASVVWFFSLGVSYRSDVMRYPVSVLRVFFPFIAIAIATTMGFLGLWTGVLLGPAGLCRRPRLKRIAILFGCAGILVDVPVLVAYGVMTIRNFDPEQLFMDWMLLGPLIVGIHCFYRLRRYGRNVG
jgi:hypothetical protein